MLLESVSCMYIYPFLLCGCTCVMDGSDDYDIYRSLCFCHSHSALTDNEKATFHSIVKNAYAADNFHGRSMCARDVMVRVAPNHSMCQDGELRGFRMTVADDLAASVLPISRNMFYGHTGVEIADLGADASLYADLVHGDVSKLGMSMLGFLKDVEERGKCEIPSLRCVPSATCSPIGGDFVYPYASALSGYVDSVTWNEELPSRIGFYHAYVRDMETGRRAHKLFAVCSAGCTRAADELFNLHLDVGRTVSVGEFCNSEEMWWLRNCSLRMRRRLLKRLCDWFRVNVTSCRDVHAYGGQDFNATSLAVAHYNTFDVSMEFAKDCTSILTAARHSCGSKVGGDIKVGSCEMCRGVLCADVPRSTVSPSLFGRSSRRSFVEYWNHCTSWGVAPEPVLYPTYPADGYWLWHRGSRCTLGTVSEDGASSSVFPTGSFSAVNVGGYANGLSTRRNVFSIPSVHCGRVANSVFIRSQTDSRVVVYGGKDLEPGYYQFPNDTYLQSLQRMGWCRDNGYVELMPLIVGVSAL